MLEKKVSLINVKLNYKTYIPNLWNCIPLFGTLPFSLPMPVRLLEYGILYGLTLRASRCLLESRKKLFHHNFHITAWQVKVSN